MANIGDIIQTPEMGYKRFQCMNFNISYIGTFTNDSDSDNLKYTDKLNDQIVFYFYGTKLLILDNKTTNGSNNIKIDIDGVVDTYNNRGTTTNNYNTCVYMKDGLERKVHKVIITNASTDTTIRMGLQNIDIDEDGYMVYCDTNGKLYYDVTPIMTSDNTPSPYVASTSNYENKYDAFHLFDGTSGSAWSTSPSLNMKQGEVILDFGTKQLINTIIMECNNYSTLNPTFMPKNFIIYGSEDGSTYNEIIEVTEQTNWKIAEKRLFVTNNTSSYRYYKIYVYENNGYSCVNIGELRYLLSVDTPFYLIQDNTTGKVYNYDEETNSLIEAPDTSILKEDAINNTCIYDLNKIKDLIDLTDENIKILCNINTNLCVNGLKNDKELIISNQNLSTVNADIIHDFILETNKVANGDIKFVISNDNGSTWQTWNGTNWTSLTNTCSLKKYSLLSDSEKIQWDKLKEEIWSSGISTDTTGIDYNIILTNKTIRFAFVLYRPSYADNITLKDTQWLYDKIGVWHKLSEDDIDIAINSNMCTVTPKLQNLNNVKVNILL